MSNPNWWRFYYFPSKDNLRTEADRWKRLRDRARKELSFSAQLKLEWLIFYHTQGRKNAQRTASHFGITRKTLHKWLKRFNQGELQDLEERSRAPQRLRKRQITLTQRLQITSLRKRHPRYGKMKLAKLYWKGYGERISSWKIQKVIEEGDLYFDRVQASQLRRRQVQARIHQRQRITKLRKEDKVHYLWHVDTVVLALSSGGYRYLLTAIDELSKLAFARLYPTHSSRNAREFLGRLVYLTDNRVVNLHHDNGSEFKKEFQEACRELSLPQWYSRPHTPRDNAVLERFNRTIQEEFIETTDVDPLFTEEFNDKLTDWLIEYNSQRPHQALAYQTPLEYLDSCYSQVSPMSSSRTAS